MRLSRIPSHRYSEIITEGVDRLPARIAERLGHVQWFCGTDPGFAGLHAYDTITGGRSYADTAHCCYPFNLNRPASDRVTTIVLPTLDRLTPVVVVHELGHALHPIAGFDHTARPTTDYAETNHYEAFAEAFTTWLHHGYGNDDVLHSDGPTLALLSELAS